MEINIREFKMDSFKRHKKYITYLISTFINKYKQTFKNRY